MKLTSQHSQFIPLLDEKVENFPVNELDFYSNSSNLKIVIFTPSLSFGNQYASMLLLAFRHYFMEGKSFLDNKPKIDFIFIINHESTTDAFNLRTIEDYINKKSCFVYYDKNEKYFNLFGIQASKDLNANTAVFLLNEENKILWRTDAYRANGEKIKPLDNAIKAYLNIPNINKIEAQFCPVLNVGDKAPDFILKGISFEDDKTTFLNDTADIKILSFYPAVFSGILNMPKKLSSAQSCLNPLHCRKQTSILDSIDLPTTTQFNSSMPKLKKYLITNTTAELLELWKNTSDTKALYYLNDEDCSIAQKYHAFHSEGYNTRLTYIIDSHGIIQAILDLKTDEDMQALSTILENFA